MRFCWADKLAILWAFVVMLAVVWVASPSYAAFHSAHSLFTIARGLLILVGPVWIFLRLVDWLIGGPRRRRDEIRVYRC